MTSSLESAMQSALSTHNPEEEGVELKKRIKLYNAIGTAVENADLDINDVKIEAAGQFSLPKNTGRLMRVGFTDAEGASSYLWVFMPTGDGNIEFTKPIKHTKNDYVSGDLGGSLFVRHFRQHGFFADRDEILEKIVFCALARSSESQVNQLDAEDYVHASNFLNFAQIVESGKIIRLQKIVKFALGN